MEVIGKLSGNKKYRRFYPITFNLTEPDWKNLDKLVSDGVFRNRSEGIRQLVKISLSLMLGEGEEDLNGIHVESGNDVIMKSFKMTRWMSELTKARAENLGFRSWSEYMRYLVVKDVFVKRRQEMQ